MSELTLSVLHASGTCVGDAIAALALQASQGICSSVQRVILDRSSDGPTFLRGHSLLVAAPSLPTADAPLQLQVPQQQPDATPQSLEGPPSPQAGDAGAGAAPAPAAAGGGRTPARAPSRSSSQHL